MKGAGFDGATGIARLLVLYWGTCFELPKDSVYWLPANNIQSTEGLVGPRKGIRHPKEMCSSNFLILLTSIYMTYNSRDSIQGLIYVGQVFYD